MQSAAGLVQGDMSYIIRMKKSVQLFFSAPVDATSIPVSHLLAYFLLLFECVCLQYIHTHSVSHTITEWSSEAIWDFRLLHVEIRAMWSLVSLLPFSELE